MYRTFDALWQGWKKNLYPLMGGSSKAIGSEIFRAVLPVLATLLVAVLVYGLIGSIVGALVVLVIGMVSIFIAYRMELKRNQFSGGLGWYGIPGRLLFGGVLWASYRSHRKGKLEWKGREYPVGTPGASK